DLSEGAPLPALRVDDHQLIAVMPARALLVQVPDPVKAQDKKFTQGDPILGEYQGLRSQTQRMFEGAKAKNAVRYADYIGKGTNGDRHFVLPAITLFTPNKLVTHAAGHGLHFAMLPLGGFFVCIDGETQRRAIQLAAAMDLPVKVIIHHGRSIEW